MAEDHLDQEGHHRSLREDRRGILWTLTLGAYNATDDPVEIPIGERFCQMIFEGLTSKSMKDYSERSGHYQNQTGVTLEAVNKK